MQIDLGRVRIDFACLRFGLTDEITGEAIKRLNPKYKGQNLIQYGGQAEVRLESGGRRECKQ